MGKAKNGVIEKKCTEFNSNVAHIVYAADDGFAEILGVSMVSLYENSKDMDEIIIYILDSGITTENKKKLKSVADDYLRSTPIFIEAKDISQELCMEVEVDRGSLSQYSRLFVSSDLPRDLERVLYLDCDILIIKSIKELWNLNFNGKTIAALMDAFSKYYRRNIDLQPEDIMFNSGVMLIDLKRWKEKKIEDKLMQFISSKNGKIQQGDQGALNSVLSHDIYCFEPRFNSVTIFYDFTYTDMLIYRKPPKFYTEVQVKEAVDDPNVIHFTTSFLSNRPWVEGCQHRYVEEWMKYKTMSPWKDSALWKDNCPGWKRRGSYIYKLIPGKIALHLAGIMQAYGRPIRNWLKNTSK